MALVSFELGNARFRARRADHLTTSMCFKQNFEHKNSERTIKIYNIH